MNTRRRQYDAVILIDMQDDFIPKLREGAIDILLDSQIKILRECALYDVPCAILEFKGYGQTTETLVRELRQVKRRLTIIKHYNSGFSNNMLDNILRRWRCTNLLLTGVNAEYCVLATAQSAIRKGYQIMTSPGLISGMPNHDPYDCIDWYSRNGTLMSI